LYSKEKSPRVLSRDYLYHLDTKPAPSITLYGGKITTYRKLAEEAVNALQAVFPNMAISKTVDTPLPGSQLDTKSYQAYANDAEKNYVWLNQETLRRWLRTYGTRTAYWLDSIKNAADLGTHFGHGLYQVEVDYLLREEWASSSEDILWRRTKLGLYFSEAEKKCLDAYIIDRLLTV
jgi:glycerol-3-phosphate dehydrogenase